LLFFLDLYSELLEELLLELELELEYDLERLRFYFFILSVEDYAA